MGCVRPYLQFLCPLSMSPRALGHLNLKQWSWPSSLFSDSPKAALLVSPAPQRADWKLLGEGGRGRQPRVNRAPSTHSPALSPPPDSWEIAPLTAKPNPEASAERGRGTAAPWGPWGAPSGWSGRRKARPCLSRIKARSAPPQSH